jgi:hypothetical protein
MVDTAPVAASTVALVENGALPQRCELTTCRAHLNEFVRDDFEVLVDDRTWYPEGREPGMLISVWHCATAGAAVACAVVDAVASGAPRRCHLGCSGRAAINCWKGIIVAAEEGQRVLILKAILGEESGPNLWASEKSTIVHLENVSRSSANMRPCQKEPGTLICLPRWSIGLLSSLN